MKKYGWIICVFIAALWMSGCVTSAGKSLSGLQDRLGSLSQANTTVVQEVIPEAVEEGESGYLMLNDSAITYAMINAIKELKAEVEILKERINELEKGS